MRYYNINNKRNLSQKKLGNYLQIIGEIEDEKIIQFLIDCYKHTANAN